MLCPTCKTETENATKCSACGYEESPPAVEPGEALLEPVQDHPEEGPGDGGREPDDSSPDGGGPDDVQPGQAVVDQSTSTVSVTNEARNITVNGDQVGQQVFNELRAEVTLNVKQSEQRQEEEASFSQITSQLHVRPATKCDFIIEEIPAHLAGLRTHNLILIGCPDLELAWDAGYALMERLSIPEEQDKRVLDLRHHLGRGASIGLNSFLPESDGPRSKVAILVKAANESAESVLDDLMADTLSAESVESTLRANRVYLICIVRSGYIDERRSDPSRELKTPFWKIPFLRPLLKQHFEDYEILEQRVMCQRQRGLWKADEGEFCLEIKSYLRKNRLREVIDDPSKKEPPVPAESLFKDDDHIEKSVLYSAAYFPDMTSKEFCSLVEALLGDRKVLISAPEYRQTENGSLELAHTRTEMPISHLWRDNKDRIMWKWLRETYSSRNAANVIDFSDYQLKDSLINFLEADRRFLLKDNFKRLQDQGFLFYPSNQLSENLTLLTHKMMLAYPDEFNKDWLVELITQVRDSFEPAHDSTAGPRGHISQFLKPPASSALALAYSRLSELMRQSLKDVQLEEVVPGTLAELIRLGYHDCVLNLVRRLRSVPEFDEFYWIKQLLDQGDMEARLLTSRYLHNRIRKSGLGILESYQFLEGWLPKDGRPPGKYARSSTYALRSLIQRCLEAVEDLEPDSYGAWPSPYPLFAFNDRETADRSLGQIMRWLFHPAMTQASQELYRDARSNPGFARHNNLIGALIAEWYFILKGAEEKTHPPSGGTVHDSPAAGGPAGLPSSNADSIFDVDSLISILMDGVRTNSGERQRKEMIEYWGQLRAEMSFHIRFPGYSSNLRAQFIWRNNRLWELIGAVKRLN